VASEKDSQKEATMMAIKGIVQRLTNAFRWRRSRLTLAAILLLASMVLLGAGLAGLLLTGEDGPIVTYVGELVTSDNGVSTATATPVPGPPPNDSPVVRMIIEKIGVDAPVITLGLDENSVPEVPTGPSEVAWYNWSSPPGWGSNAVFSGHVDWTVNGQPVVGVFYYLHDLGLDDVIKIVLEDGTEYSYKVTANQAIEDGDPTALEVMGPTPKDMVTLVTCGGIWIRDWTDPLGGRYTHRQVVQGELIEEEPLPSFGVAP
jgi:sortase (surface protein transpeptidase)